MLDEQKQRFQTLNMVLYIKLILSTESSFSAPPKDLAASIIKLALVSLESALLVTGCGNLID